MRTPKTRAVLLAGLLLAASALAGVNPPTASAAADPVTVTVNTRAGLATVPDTALGVNHAIWDSNLGTAETSDLLRDAGVQMMRYPGGSYADIYHWKDHTAPGGYVAPGTDFDTFMAAVRRVGAQPMIIANYGTGTPAEAADWVRYANVTKGYDARYWTIGNENYGNGHYGSAWEADDHPDKSATQYARLVVEYADAMKAVDPSIKVGAVLTMPGNWPDGITAGSDPGPWNQTVLSIAGPKIDFVDVHWYPGGTAAESLARVNHLPDATYLLRQQTRPVRRRERRPHRHQFHRAERRRRPEHPTGGALPGRRLQRTTGERRLHRTVVERAQRHGHRDAGGRPDRLRRLRDALQRGLHRGRLGLPTAAEHTVRAVPRAEHDEALREGRRPVRPRRHRRAAGHRPRRPPGQR